jgi:hypothetical protein
MLNTSLYVWRLFTKVVYLELCGSICITDKGQYLRQEQST